MIECDILIVGLGPVGAVAANLAGMAGFNTVVIERGDEPYQQPRAIHFDAEIMRIFASIGLADEIAKVIKPGVGSVFLGADYKPIRTFRARPRPHELAFHSSHRFYQPQLEAILRAGLDRYRNVKVLRNREAVAIKTHRTKTTVTINAPSGEETDVVAKYVLGCDGASSFIRKSLGIALDDVGFEERWLVVDTLVSGPMRWPDAYELPEEVRDNRFSLMICDPARPATLIPGAGNHRRWEYMLLAGERDEDVVTKAWLDNIIGAWIDLADVEIVRAAVYRFRALVAKKWSAGGVFILGDAAHQTPPFFGQGMCHGIRDAAQLIWRLRLLHEGCANAEIVDSFQVEREPHVREIITASVTSGKAICTLDPVEARARDAAFRAAESARGHSVATTDVVPPIRGGIIDENTGGSLLPEFILADADDKLCHIDKLLAGRFTLLSIGKPMNIDDPRWAAIGAQTITLDLTDTKNAALRDADGRLGAWADDKSVRHVVVRPDRYIYAIAEQDDAIASILDQLFTHLHVAATACDIGGGAALSEEAYYD